MNNELIFSGKFCPYCGRKTEQINSAEIYHGVSYGLAYICRPCAAYVGCYKGTQKALGRLANAKLRKYKRLAHEAFDQIWKIELLKKHEAYSWLSERLGIKRDHTHIGMFDVDLCEKVIEVCQDYMFQCEMEGILHKSQQQRPLGLYWPQIKPSKKKV